MNDVNRSAARLGDFDDEINLMDLLLVMLKRKGMILWVVVLAALFSFLGSQALPEWYTATARILPPQESGPRMSSLLNQVSGSLSGLIGGLPGGESGSEVYVGILQSRSIADTLIHKFKLKRLYEEEYLEDVFEELGEHTRIEVSHERIISVSVEDRDPRRAADMANMYVTLLDKINRTLNITEGHQKRVFLENRLKEIMRDLSRAEKNLRDFQEKNKLVDIEDQARVAIEGAARIKAEIIAAQTELKVLKEFGTEKQNEVIMLRSKLAELGKQLLQIEKGQQLRRVSKKNEAPGGDSNFYIPFTELPELGMQLARLMREARIQQQVFELLTSQYELAKIEEAKDVNTIQILDKAMPPDKPSSPKTLLILVFTAGAAFIIGTLLAFFTEYLGSLKTTDNERYQQFINGLKPWKTKPSKPRDKKSSQNSE